MIVGAKKTSICNECVKLCVEILEEDIVKARKEKLHAGDKNILNPVKIKEHLDQYIIGQDAAKTVLSVAVSNHYKRIVQPPIEFDLDKSNVMVLGATGAGKTIITAALCQLVEPYGRTLTIVPNKSLVTQTEEDFVACNLDVGVYYGDRKELGRFNTIATWQSLNVLEKKSKDEHSTDFLEAIQGINTVIIDEVHMAKADVLKRLLTGPFAHCGIRWGLTGTVPKADYEFMGLKCSIGEVANRIQASELQNKGVLANCHVNVLQTQDHPQFKTYAEELKWLTTDSTRMGWVANTIKDISTSGNTLILVDRISAGEILNKKLKDSVFISGSTKNLERKEHYDEVSTTQNKIIIATYGVASVGINIPRIFNLVLIEPGKSFVRVIQSIGRGIRKAEDKDNVQIWDITSSCKFAKRHLGARKKFYKEANYPYNIEKIDTDLYENTDT